MAKKNNGKAKAKAAERRRHKSDESTEDDEPIAARTRAARSRRPNTEKQASSKSRKSQESGGDADDAISDSGNESASGDESDRSDENSSVDDSASSETSEDSQANPPTSSRFDTEIPSDTEIPFDTEMQDAPDVEQGRKSKRKEKRRRKQDRRVEEESESSDEQIASNTNQKGKQRKGKSRRTSRRGEDESASEGSSGDTQSKWGWACQRSRRRYPMRATKSPGYDKITLKYDPDATKKDPLKGKIRYALDYRGYLFVTGPSLEPENLGLERAWLLKGSDYPEEKARFVKAKGVTPVAKAEELRDIPPGKFHPNNIAMTLDGQTGVFESWGDHPGQKRMRIWTLPSVRSGYGAREADYWASKRRRKVGQGPVLSKHELKTRRAVMSLK